MGQHILNLVGEAARRAADRSRFASLPRRYLDDVGMTPGELDAALSGARREGYRASPRARSRIPSDLGAAKSHACRFAGAYDRQRLTMNSGCLPLIRPAAPMSRPDRLASRRLAARRSARDPRAPRNSRRCTSTFSTRERRPSPARRRAAGGSPIRWRARKARGASAAGSIILRGAGGKRPCSRSRRRRRRRLLDTPLRRRRDRDRPACIKAALREPASARELQRAAAAEPWEVVERRGRAVQGLLAVLAAPPALGPLPAPAAGARAPDGGALAGRRAAARQTPRASA